MGCLVKGLVKYLEPRPRNEEKEYVIKSSNEDDFGKSENLKLKNNKNKYKKLNAKEKSLKERENELKKMEENLINDKNQFELYKKDFDEQIEKDKKFSEEINTERNTLIKIKSNNEQKEKEIQLMTEKLNKEKEDMEIMKTKLHDKENELKEKEGLIKNKESELNEKEGIILNRENELNKKEGLIKNKENELLNSTNIFNNKNNELEQKKQELIMKENDLVKKEKELNLKETQMSTKNVPILIGLNNIGATCYMNASLQCFSNTKKLTNYFLEHYVTDPKNTMSNEYFEVLKNLWNIENNNKSYSPNSFKDVLSKENELFAGVQANDSKDLINFLLERFHQELNVAKNVNDIDNVPNGNQPDQSNEQLMLKLFLDEIEEKFDSIISNLFYGILETKSQCKGCNIIKYNFQVYSFIEFPLQQVNQYFFNKGARPLLTEDGKNPDIDLYECFEYNEKVDLMDGENQMFCNQCNKLCDSTYTTKLYSGPNYLIINLNRGKGAVYECKVNFPEQLNIFNFVTFKQGITVYELYAVICHLGPSSMSGHFVAYCRNRIDNKWYLYNDAFVTLCDKQKQYTEGMPYILFYRALKSGDNPEY